MTIQIDCKKSLDISSIGRLHQLLLDALTKEHSVVLAGEHISHVDVIGLQLISSFIKDAKLQGVKVSWLRPSDELIEKARLLGLSHSVNLS